MFVTTDFGDGSANEQSKKKQGAASRTELSDKRQPVYLRASSTNLRAGYEVQSFSVSPAAARSNRAVRVDKFYLCRVSGATTRPWPVKLVSEGSASKDREGPYSPFPLIIGSSRSFSHWIPKVDSLTATNWGVPAMASATNILLSLFLTLFSFSTRIISLLINWHVRYSLRHSCLLFSSSLLCVSIHTSCYYIHVVYLLWWITIFRYWTISYGPPISTRSYILFLKPHGLQRYFNRISTRFELQITHNNERHSYKELRLEIFTKCNWYVENVLQN